MVIREYTDVIAKMEGCYGRMEERFAGLLQSEKAQQQLLAGTTYAFIRLVRCKSILCGVAMEWHGLVSMVLSAREYNVIPSKPH